MNTYATVLCIAAASLGTWHAAAYVERLNVQRSCETLTGFAVGGKVYLCEDIVKTRQRKSFLDTERKQAERLEGSP